MTCHDLSAVTIVSTHEELASLEFSDYTQGDSSLKVDILVSLDQYWKLVTGEVIRCLNGPTPVHTRLGWVLSGPVQGQALCKSTLLTLIR